MPSFSDKSLERLSQCDKRLQVLFNEVVLHWDCSVMVGFRDADTQNEAFRNGLSKQKWPDSKHNQQPSMACDVAPYPIDFRDTARFYYFAGFVMGTAKSLGIKLRWGGDFSMDNQVKDERFLDLVHFELV